MLVSAAVAGCAGQQPQDSPTARVIERAQLRAAPAGRVVAPIGRFTEYGDPRVYRVVGRRGRWLAVLAPERPNGRAAWIAAEHAVLGSVRWSITLDRSARRLTLRRSGQVVRRMLVTVGAASSPTPLGRFAVTDKLVAGAGLGLRLLRARAEREPDARPARRGAPGDPRDARTRASRPRRVERLRAGEHPRPAAADAHGAARHARDRGALSGDTGRDAPRPARARRRPGRLRRRAA